MFKLIDAQTPTRKIILSFVLVIALGFILLSLPISQLPSSQANYLDHLFTTVSMVCVTGLATLPVAETYNTLGQIFCMLLIQIGGLSLLTLIGLLAIQTSQRLRLKDRSTLQESLASSETLHIKDFIRSVVRFTLGIECLGACLLALIFIPQLGWAKGSFTAVFIAISAFCNAGFDNLGSDSLMAYQGHWGLNLIIALLIITGGLGFSIWFDCRTLIKKRQFRWKKLRFHTRVVLTWTGVILLGGTFLSLLTEFNNPATIGLLSLPQKILVSFFQTVTMRTAGFASIDYSQARPVTLLIYLLQMLIGGAPGGTAGGLKLTNVLVIGYFVKSALANQTHTNFRHRTIDIQSIRKAFLAASVFLFIFILGLMALSMTAPTVNFLHLVFETLSALATVGVTASLTPTLGRASQLVIMGLMFFGRVGPTTMLVSLSSKQSTPEAKLQYAKSNLIVG